MSANHVLLQRAELKITNSSITFSNIPQTGYTDLKIVMSSRKSANALDTAQVKINGAVASGVRWVDNNNNGTPRTGTGLDYQSLSQPNDYTASTFANVEMYIPNAFVSGVAKILSSENITANNASGAYIGFSQSVYGTVTNPVTSIEIIPTSAGGSTWAVGSSFSLYGIASVGDVPAIAPKALGGDIVVNDGVYWYHAFLSTNIFKPKGSLTCDALLVAGGGGGGANNGAGGGAGGVTLVSNYLVPSSGATVTVGAGGAGSPGNSPRGYNGSNSQIGNSTAAIGGGGGGSYSDLTPGSGGSGGGGGGNAEGGSATGGAGTSGQGYAGGNGYAAGNPNHSGGGGGGAGGAGANGNGTSAGGVGTNAYTNWGSITQTGHLVNGYFYYAGGGGGAKSNTSGGSGGYGGGGNGGGATLQAEGTANTGGGGGGQPNQGTGSTSTGKAGGSGIVIIRYAMD